MITTIHADLTATVTSDDGKLECHFPAYDVETLEPINTPEQARAQAEKVRGREGLFLTPKAVELGNLRPTPPDFLLLLTLRERAALRSIRQSDLVVNDLLSLIEDSRLAVVELASPGLIEAIHYLTTTTPALLTEERAQRVLAGLPPENVSQLIGG